MTNQLIETLENQHKEMGLLIQQLKAANITIEDVKEHFGVATDVIEFEGKKYRKVDRLAREGDVIIAHEGSVFVKKNTPYKVENEKGNLTLNKGTTDVVFLFNGPRTPETVDVYEPITSPVFATNEGQDLQAEYAEQVKEEKTPNQLRAEIIEKAKLFLEQRKDGFGDYNFINKKGALITCSVEFLINEGKRKIVALMKGANTNRVRANGIAICAEGDVFNEHIGKAIALGRALEVDVSEFENAVQPNEVVMGMDLEIRTNGEVDFTHEPVDEEDLLDCNKDFQKDVRGVFVINDTNAQYGGNA